MDYKKIKTYNSTPVKPMTVQESLLDASALIFFSIISTILYIAVAI